MRHRRPNMWQQWLQPFTTLSLRGRATRTQWYLYQLTTLPLFWLPLLWTGMPALAESVWTARCEPKAGEEWLWYYLAGALVVFSMVGVPLTVRRLHDMGCSGYWVLLPLLCWLVLLPFNSPSAYAFLFFVSHAVAIGLGMLILGHARGDRGENDYGDDPRFSEKQIS